MWCAFLVGLIAAAALTSAVTFEQIRVACNQNVAIMFLIDGSDSIAAPKFTRVRAYVTAEIERIKAEFSEVTVMVSVMVYSSSARYTRFVDIRDFVWQDDLLGHPRRATNTGGALQAMVSIMEKYNRDDFARVAVVITDGISINPANTADRAKTARDRGIVMIGLGVGSMINSTEIRAIASDHMAYSVGPFYSLEEFFLVWRKDCPITSPNMGESAECASMIHLVWAVDLALSVQAESIRSLQRFIMQQSRVLRLGHPSTRIGLVTFSTDIVETVYPSGNRFNNAVSRMRPVRGVSNTAVALKTAATILLSLKRNVPKYAVLVTDGVSLDTSATRYEAAVMKESGIRIIVIAVGSIDNAGRGELANIASRNLLFPLPSYPSLAGFTLGDKFDRRCGRATTPAPWTWPTLSRSTRKPWTWPKISQSTRKPWTWPKISQSTRKPWTWPTWTRSSKVRTAATVWTFPSLPPQRRSTRKPTTGICQGCDMSTGTGYVPHPSSCSKYVVCKNAGGGKITHSIHDCPIGLFWDQSTLICDYPTNAKCLIDPCPRWPQPHSYGDPYDCQIYWICENGRTSAGKCCSIQQRFDNFTHQCVQDHRCQSVKCGMTSNLAKCDELKAHKSVKTMYMQFEAGKWVMRHCAPGTAFPVGGCSCNETIPIVASTISVPVCTGPELHLSFDRDFSNTVRKNIYIGVNGVKIQAVHGAIGGGAARFDGSGSINIPRYKNIDWPSYVLIKFRYLADVNINPSAALLTNGVCRVNPSLAISLADSGNEVKFHARTNDQRFNVFTNSQPTLRFVNASLTEFISGVIFKCAQSGWTSVQLEMTKGTSRRNGYAISTVNGKPYRQRLEGSIVRTGNDLILGQGQGFGNFSGYIDEFFIYLCNPTRGPAP